MTRVLIKGAAIVTMDDALGDLASGDILVEDGRIAAVQPASTSPMPRSSMAPGGS